MPKFASINEIIEKLNEVGIDELLNDDEFKKFKNLLIEINELINKYKRTEEYKDYSKYKDNKNNNKEAKYEDMFISLEDGKKLEENYRQALDFTKKIFDNEKLNKQTNGLFSEVNNLLINDYKSISNTDFNKLVTISEVLDKSRVKTLNIADKTASKVGAASSSREAVSFVDESGKAHYGFFTKERKFNSVEDCKNLFNSYRDKCLKIQKKENESEKKVNSAKLIITFLNKFQNKVLDEIANLKSDYLSSLSKSKDIAESLEKIKREEFKDKFTDEDLLSKFSKKFSSHAGKIFTQFVQYSGLYSIKAEEDSSITRRNVAMSIVANMLGMPDIIANSFDVELKKGNETIKGVFMEKARGYDVSKKEDAKIIYGLKKNAANVFNNVSAKKSLSNLNLLDYICQNGDRHQSNMLYILDKEKKHVIGVQGIDNDLSFGTEDIKEEDIRKDTKSKVLMPFYALSKAFITEQTAKNIKAISSEMLEYALLNTGLKEKEIKAACKRLEEVKVAIDKKQIKVLSDKQIDNVSFDNLVNDFRKVSEGSNAFDEAARCFSACNTTLNKNSKTKDIDYAMSEFKDLNEFYMEKELKDFTELMNKSTDPEFKNLSNQILEVGKELKDELEWTMLGEKENYTAVSRVTMDKYAKAVENLLYYSAERMADLDNPSKEEFNNLKNENNMLQTKYNEYCSLMNETLVHNVKMNFAELEEDDDKKKNSDASNSLKNEIKFTKNNKDKKKNIENNMKQLDSNMDLS